VGTIVVGVDGSKGAEAALQWAVEEAKLRGADLELVYGWIPPAAEADPTGMAIARCREPGEEILRTAEAEVRAWAPELEVRVALVPLPGAAALVGRSEHADLVVVGTRGRGGFVGLLLGSVSTQVVHHAHCPVVVVRS